jgi:phosphatidylinositol alpha-1,6-mannosyltransferase
MRVLYLTDSLSDLDGVGRYALELIRALERLEPSLEVSVLLARDHRPTSADVPARWRIEVALPPDWFFRMGRLRFWASYAAAVRRVRRAAREVDLVHAIKDYPHNLVGLVGARRAGVPCVATGHGTYTVQPLLSTRHAARARWAYRRFAALISVSRFTARRVREILGAEEAARVRLEVIPNAVDAGRYLAPSAIGPRPWHAHPFTLSIGELKERKGHHLALAGWCRVAASHPALHHYVVGKESGDPYQRSLEALVDRAGLAQRVHWLGNVSEEEKVDLLQRALVFLHTPVVSSDGGFEGFGIVYLEAAAAGTPSIGTLGSGAEDAIEEGTSGLLVPPEPAAVEAALRALLEDEPRRAAMGRSARERARRLTWEDNARRVLAIYREVLE